VIDYPETPRGGLILPDGRVLEPHLEEGDNGVARVPGMMTRSEWDQLGAVLRGKYFFFRNDTGETGERMVCKARNPDGSMRGCGRKHSHITCMCIELPFKGGSGLEAGLYAVFQATSDPLRRELLQTAIQRLPDLYQRLPDIATGHPFSARAWAPQEPGRNWLGALVSLPEPIKEAKAREKAIQINDAKPPIRLCLKQSCENYLEADVWCAGRAHSYL